MKHKRISRAGISLLLVLCMVLSICPLTAFAKEDNRPKLNYVSLGASNANGYGLRGYLKPTGDYNDDTVMEAAALDSSLKSGANVLGYNQAPSTSYPALLKAALEEQQGNTVKLDQLAISSMRAEELRILLDNNYNGDAYSAWRFIGKGNWFDIADGKKDGKFEKLREEYQTAVENADLITVDIGANNFGVYLSQMLTNNFKFNNDLNLVDPQIGKLYNGAKAEVNALLAEYGISVEDYAELADTLVYALVGFCYNFDKSVERIYELNPDATVVVVSIQNLMAGLGAKLGDVEVPLGDIIGALINTANTYIAIGSPYSSKYLCADVRQNGRVEFFIDKMAAYDGNIETIDKNIIDCFNVYDGNPKDSYDKGFHVKYQVAQMLITADGDINTLDKAKDFLETDNGKALLNKVYDAYAQILSAGAKINTLDLATLDQLDNFKSVQNKLETAIGNEIVTAAKSEFYTLPDNFFSAIASSCNVQESIVETVVAMAVRTDIGNSFFSHPTPDGHQKVADAILATLANKTTGEDIIKNEIEIAGEQLYRFAYDHGAESLVKLGDAAELMQKYLDKYGPEALEYVENYLIEEGYVTADEIAEITKQVKLAIAAYEAQDKAAMKASCEKLAELVYAYADANGYIPAEVNDVVSISVKTAPTKTNYVAGQNFDSTGMVITVTYNDGTTADKNSGWTVTNGTNLTAGTTTVTISYTEGGDAVTCTQDITVVAKALTGISVKTAPTKTSYIAGQNFDSTGMVIEKKYNDDSTATATGWTVTDGTNLTAGKTTVTISYTEGGVTKTITQAITVNSSNPGPGPGGGGAASYTVSTATATHGKVTVDKTSASAGDTVTITVAPEKGFTLETLTVKDAKGNEVALTAVKTGETYTFKMPAGKVTVSATFMEDNTMLNFFVDVPATEYYYDAVLWAAKNGITLGVDDTHFAPMAIATRGQMVTFLWRAAGCPEPTSTTCAFTDVKTSEYYYKAVLWAVETGITKGTSDTTFSPDENVSRSQTVTFLARMSGVKDDATGYSHNFADVKTTDYYNNAVAWAATNKITVGTSATTFSPNDDCLRGQIVTFLYRNFVK